MAHAEALAQQLKALQLKLQQQHRKIVEGGKCQTAIKWVWGVASTDHVFQSQTRDRLPLRVDTECIDKPATFSGKEEEWPEWSVKLGSDWRAGADVRGA
eukprot:4396797-Amphidinium_carterae.1